MGQELTRSGPKLKPGFFTIISLAFCSLITNRIKQKSFLSKFLEKLQGSPTKASLKRTLLQELS